MNPIIDWAVTDAKESFGSILLFTKVESNSTICYFLTAFVNSRYTDLRARWTTAGASITDDLTTSVATSLSGRDLVVISQLWANNSLFDAAAISAIASYLDGGGEALYIAQVSSSSHLTSYNTFLVGIGSSMQFLANSGDSDGVEVIDTDTPYGQGVNEFDLGGWTALSGGIPVVTLNGEVGVAFGTASAPTAIPVPAMNVRALVILSVVILLVGGFGVRRRVHT